MIVREQLIRQYIAEGNNPPSPRTTKNSTMKTTINDVIQHAIHFYSMLQCSDGHWSGDYGGPHFLMPGLIITWYVMKQPIQMFRPTDIELMKHYIQVHQQIDGGWGTHIESPSTMFGTVLNYVALRLLGLSSDDPVCIKGKEFIQNHGGAIMTGSWAKFYLCLLGCMEWDGHNSVPAEMWLLPTWTPFHPSRMWCHARMVYLPMGYLYGVRFVYREANIDPIVLSLRNELYCEPYESISWIHTRHNVAPMDNYSPIPWIMKTLQNILARYETWSIFQPIKNYIRPYGLDFCVSYMAAEDAQTNFIDIGPVNKVLNMLSAYHIAEYDIMHPNVMNHMVRVADYMWIAEDGMKMKGYNGSQCWDTSFAIQAIAEANMLDEFPIVTKRVWDYLERTQILSTDISQTTSAYRYESPNYRKMYFRHISKGGWPFSNSAHGWPIADCTAEGLKGILCLLKSKTIQDSLKENKIRPIRDERLYDAVHILLSYQNEDGGFATYGTL
jgi:cycloartenol synthase